MTTEPYKNATLEIYDREAGDGERMQRCPASRYLVKCIDTDKADRGVAGDDLATLLAIAKFYYDERHP